MTVLAVDRLAVEIPTPRGALVAVQDASFTISRGDFVAIVGESGAGKTTLANALIGHLRPPARITSGAITKGQSVAQDGAAGEQRPRTGYVVTNPASHLDPMRRIGAQVAAAYRFQQGMGRAQARELAAQALRTLGIPDVEHLMRAYPHQISGGMAQRVVIAIALASDPELVIADEPVSGLDVTLQRQILDEITRHARERNAAVILITHDLGLAAAYCRRVIVMYSGLIVEDAPAREFFEQPRHPYSVQLVAAVSGGVAAPAVGGAGARLAAARTSCPYADACPVAVDRCTAEMPALETVDERTVRCFVVQEGSRGRPS